MANAFNVEEPAALPSTIPAAEIEAEGVAAIKTEIPEGERRTRMLDVFRRYCAGESIRQIEKAGYCKATVSTDLHTVQDMVGKSFIVGAQEPGMKAHIARITRVKREHGQRAASIRDWHALRSTFVTLALAAGVPVELVRRVTGHATVETVLKHYFRPDREQFKQALAGAMPGILTGGKPKRLKPADELSALGPVKLPQEQRRKQIKPGSGNWPRRCNVSTAFNWLFGFCPDTFKTAFNRACEDCPCAETSGNKLNWNLDLNMIRVFISSVQKELAVERRAVKDFILHDPLLSRFIRGVFLFEDIPARDRKPDDIYLVEVEQSDIYLAILGNNYGRKNHDGKSSTELEFDHATKTHRERLVFVKGDDDKKREPAMAVLVNKAGRQVTRRRFTDTPGLIREVYASLVDCLENRGALITKPFDDSICTGATLQDIDNDQVTSFVETAEAKGRLALKGSRAPKAVLQNFNLLWDGKPTNAAILLFGKNPRRFFNNAQVHCFHFHGIVKQKPIASQQPYEGRLFEVIDQAVEFVLGKLNRSVGTRAKSIQAPVEFEIPRPAITEAIVNAVAHRNYRHNGFVQVIVFADRVEVWNPGELPPGLTPELLRQPHGPIPRNPLIAEPLFRVKYVEKAGTGTTDMIADCLAAGLPEPDFKQCGPHFVTTLWRDWLTEEVMTRLELSERQQQAIRHLKTTGKITNQNLRELTGAVIRTASRDLDDLVKKRILKKVGATGRNTHYILARKLDTNRT